jgi:hypothetical protein
LWDLRRLIVGVVIGLSASNPDDAAAGELALGAAEPVARATVEGYVDAVRRMADGAHRRDVGVDVDSPIIADLLDRSADDLADKAELGELTSTIDGKRVLKRGVYGDDSQETLADLPRIARDTLPSALEAYRRSLVAPPEAKFFTVLDAARKFGGGVASWPRVRILVLVRGPSDSPDDDVVLEMRELIDSGLGVFGPQEVYFDSPVHRVLSTSRAAWRRPDAAPLWGAATFLGLPVQVRWETEGQKTFRTRRFAKALGTPDANASFGRDAATVLARVHGASTDESAAPARELWRIISVDPEDFAREQIRVALEYARQVTEDHQHFNNALRRLGPTLGVVIDPADAPHPDLRALYGTPPAPALP